MVYGSTVNLKPERVVESMPVLSGQFNWAIVDNRGYVLALFSQKKDAEAMHLVTRDTVIREVENN